MTAPHGAVQLSADAGVPLSEETTQAAQTAFHDAVMAMLHTFLACKGPGPGHVAYQDAMNRVRDLHWGALAEVRRLRALASVSPVPAPTPEAVQIDLAARAICGAWGYCWDGDPEDLQTAPERAESYDERPDKVLYRTAARAVLTALATPQPPREGEKDSKRARTLIPIADWHEDDGAVLLWTLPVTEPPYCGTPLDNDAPFDATHFTYLLVPDVDAAKSATPEGRTHA